MKKICFVCHGNICRSPVAHLLFDKLVKEQGLENEFYSYSKGISNEEQDNDIYPPMKRVLDNHGVKYYRHYAGKIGRWDIDDCDYIVYMDEENYYELKKVALFKREKLLHIAAYYNQQDIEDPWYTGRYEEVYQQIYECVKSLLEHFKKSL